MLLKKWDFEIPFSSDFITDYEKYQKTLIFSHLTINLGIFNAWLRLSFLVRWEQILEEVSGSLSQEDKPMQENYL